MSNNTKAIIKSLFVIALGSASTYIYSEMMSNYVAKEIESYFK